MSSSAFDPNAPHFTSIVNLVAAELGVSIVPASMNPMRLASRLSYHRNKTSGITRGISLNYLSEKFVDH
jgi:hypothetical protein